jgi:hypothetical protein
MDSNKSGTLGQQVGRRGEIRAQERDKEGGKSGPRRPTGA